MLQILQPVLTHLVCCPYPSFLLLFCRSEEENPLFFPIAMASLSSHYNPVALLCYSWSIRTDLGHQLSLPDRKSSTSPTTARNTATRGSTIRSLRPSLCRCNGSALPLHEGLLTSSKRLSPRRGNT